jgi:uncharacterized protein (TIGR03083 family)
VLAVATGRLWQVRRELSDRAGNVPGMEMLPLLRELTAAFAHDVATAPPQARPAALQRWTVTDLAAHLGGVHRWVAEIVRTGKRAGRTNVPVLSVPPAEWYAESRDLLLAALTESVLTQPCWTLIRDWREVSFWHRRQTHETLVHLWDLRSAVDPAAPPPPEVPPAVHADGVDEMFRVFLGRASPEQLRPLPRPLGLRATDTGHSWLLAEDWSVSADAQRAGGTEVAAPAGDLLLFAWSRTPATGRLAVTGPEDAVIAFRRARFRA